MRVLFAAERLVPPVGGAELFALEVLAGLAARGHGVGGVCVAAEGARGAAGVPVEVVDAGPLPAGYWAGKAVCGGALAAAVARICSAGAARPDVVLTQLHGAPGVVAAAGAASVPAVVVLPSYESLCKYAFDAGSGCFAAGRDCVACPAALGLAAEERALLVDARRAQADALASAAARVAPSAAVADAASTWSGRSAVIVAPVVGMPAACGAPASVDGPVVLAAARWSVNKGLGLLPALVDALAPREVVISPHGLPSEVGSLPHVRVVDGTLPELLSGAAVLCVPSTWPEPFGRVAFEAMALGVPVLASAVGGLASLVPAAGLVAAGADALVWASRVAALREPGAWEAARVAGLAVAARVLAEDPVGRVEALLAEVLGAR